MDSTFGAHVIFLLLSLLAFADTREKADLPSYSPNNVFDTTYGKDFKDVVDFFKKRDSHHKTLKEKRNSFSDAEKKLSQAAKDSKLEKSEFIATQNATWNARRELLEVETLYGPCLTRPILATEEGKSISDGSCLLDMGTASNATKSLKTVTESLVDTKRYPRNYKFDRSGFTHVMNFDLFEKNRENAFVITKQTAIPKAFYAQISVDTYWGSIALIKNGLMSYFFKGTIQDSPTDFFMTFNTLKDVELPEDYKKNVLREILPSHYEAKKLERVDLSDIGGMWYVLAQDQYLYLRYRTWADFNTMPNATYRKQLLTVNSIPFGRNVSSSILLDTLLQLSERAAP